MEKKKNNKKDTTSSSKKEIKKSTKRAPKKEKVEIISEDIAEDITLSFTQTAPQKNRQEGKPEAKKVPKKEIKNKPTQEAKKTIPEAVKKEKADINGTLAEDISLSFVQTAPKKPHKELKPEHVHAYKHKKQRLLFKITAIVFMLMGLYFLWGGARLIIFGGSWYYLILSITLVIMAFFLWKKNGLFYVVYSFILVGTGLWSLWEVGLRWWLLVQRLWVIFVIGLILCIPAYYRFVSKARAIVLVIISLIFIAVIGIIALLVSPDSIQGKINNPIQTQPNPDQMVGSDWVAFGGTNAGLYYSSLKKIIP